MRRSLLNMKFILLVVATYLNPGIGFSQNAYPVVLSSPMDYDTISETEPTFIWQTDIAGLSSDSRYSQRFVLSELLENQTKGEAITLNIPLVTLEDYQSLIYSYSSSASPLEMGHTYVWQVNILFNGLTIDQSEVFQFTIYEPLDLIPRFHSVAFKNDAQYLPVHDGKIGLMTEETGELNLTIDLELNGQTSQQAQLNEYIDGTLQTATTITSENKKRLFVLNVDALELPTGNYSAAWTAKPGKTYVFNFNVQ
jgi:hypothetical protein